MNNTKKNKEQPVPTIPFTVSIGVTGHMHLSKKHISRILKNVDDILFNIKSNTEKTSKLHNYTPHLRIISCLCGDSDRIVAERAMDQGWKLCAVLPFPLGSKVYSIDHDEKESIILNKQLTNICNQAESVVQLSKNIPTIWKLMNPPLTDPSCNHQLASEFRDDCYHDASKIVVEQCDILLAIWSGEPKLNKGGTFDTIMLAINNNRPVIIINSAKNILPKVVKNGLSPWKELEYKFPESIDKIYDEYIAPSSAVADKINNELIDAIKVSTENTPKTAGLWKAFQKFICRGKLNGLPTSNYLPIEDKFISIFDSSANYYASVQRSSVIKVAFLTTVAVLFSSLSSLLSDFQNVSFILSTLEIVTLLYVAFTVKNVRKQAWQSSLTRHRYIAEVLRLNIYAKKLAIDCPYESQESLYANKSDDMWLKYFLHMLVRCNKIHSIDFSKKQCLKKIKIDVITNLLEDQIAYHALNSRRSYITENFIGNFTEIMFWIALISSFLNISLGSIMSIDSILSFLSTVAPVIAISAQSISQNTELKRLTLRSGYMVTALSEIKSKLKKSKDPDEIRSLVYSSIQIMLSDATDWKSQYNIENVSV